MTRMSPHVLSSTKMRRFFSPRLLLGEHLDPPHLYVVNGASSRGVLPLRTTLLAVFPKVNERGKCGHPSRCYVTYLLRHKYMPSIVGAQAADASAVHGTRTGKHPRYPTHVIGEEPISIILGMVET